MRVAPGNFCVVIGPGPIGLMMLQYIKASGAGKVLLIGTSGDDYRIELGQSLGADYVMNTGDTRSKHYVKDPLLRVREWNEGRGADAVIIPAGNPGANELGIDLGGPRSRIVLFGGAGYGPEDTVKVKLWEGTLMEREILFSWLAPYTFSEAIEAIRDGLVKVKPLITHVYTLDEMNVAIETAENRSRNPIKVLVKPES
jgi:L-iditol 2-dehydrogenase